MVNTSASDSSSKSSGAANVGKAANEQFDIAKAAADKILERIPAAVTFEKRTGIPKFYAAVAVSSVLLIMVVFNFAGALVTNLVGFVYPAYASAKALESPQTDDDKQWLTYWVVFGFLNTIEYFSDALLSWFPFYYVMKLALLVWLYFPLTEGAKNLYVNFIRKLVVPTKKSE